MAAEIRILCYDDCLICRMNGEFDQYLVLKQVDVRSRSNKFEVCYIVSYAERDLARDF